MPFEKFRQKYTIIMRSLYYYATTFRWLCGMGRSASKGGEANLRNMVKPSQGAFKTVVMKHLIGNSEYFTNESKLNQIS